MAMASNVVVLKMDVHCVGCARRIRKGIKALYGAGVKDVWASKEMGQVFVAGPFLDASVLRWHVQSMVGPGRSVEVVEEAPPDNGQMVHLGPSQTGYGGQVYPPPYGHYYAGGSSGWVPVVPQYNYGYGARQYVPNEAPVCFNDDNPNGCCVMQ